MCGIVGYIGVADAAPILLRALRRLEYRGYDSAGWATVDVDKLDVRKDVGGVDDIVRRLGVESMRGTVGVAHTRWATHGAPTQANAHPHMDCKGTLAVVHNGVLENFLALRKELEEANHVFISRTDTETIPHLVQSFLDAGEPLEQAFIKALKKVEGTYAVAMVSSRHPDILLAARKEAPLIIGLGNGFNMVASDITALLDMTKKMVFLHDGDVAVITREGVKVVRLDTGEVVERHVKEVELTIEMAEKHGHPHFTLKEIYEQPETLRNSLRLQMQYVDLVSELLDKGRTIFLVGAGTSFNACLAASYLFSHLARLPSFPVVASEFIPNYGGSLGADTVVLAVSQSGETADVLNALEFARMRACTILGLTNTVGSTLTRISRAYILQNSGPEIGVAATKTFTSQVLVLAQIALRLSRLRGKIAQYEMDEFKGHLLRIPRNVEEVLMTTGPLIKGLAERLNDSKAIFVLGRGVSTSTAFEGRLKMMELSYVPVIAYPSGESKHGPISVVEEGTPVIFVIPPDDYRKLNIGSVMEMKARGAYTVIFGDREDFELKNVADFYVGLPRTHPLLTPITYSIPFQLLAYHMAVLKGYDPDKPRNLAKSVTVL